MFALARAPRRRRLDDLANRPGDIIVLDGVRTTGNIGAITRSARGFGAAGLVAVDSRLATVYDRRLVRASRALVFALPLVIATAEEVIDFLHEQRLPLVSLSPVVAGPLSTVGAMSRRIAMLLGSERSGPSSTLEGAAERRVSIPTQAGIESLNVSVAAAIALYERQRTRLRDESVAEAPLGW